MKDNKDRDEVLAAVKLDGLNRLNEAHKSLQKDREIVMAAVKQNGWALQYADKSLQKDRKIVMAAVKQDSNTLQYADESLQKDRKIVMAAVKQKNSMDTNNHSLEFADKSLKKDKEIVMAAVKQNGLALEYADKSLKKDKEIFMVARKKILAAIKKENPARNYMGKVYTFGNTIHDAGEFFRTNREIFMAAVKQYGIALSYADKSFKKDKEIVMTAVKQEGCAIMFADESLKKDREIVLAAVKSNGHAIMHADESLQKDREFLLAVVKENGEALEFADQLKLSHDEDNEDELLKKDKRIAMAAISTLKKGKRRFRIDAGNYGGELVVGTVDEAFIEDFDPELIDNWYEEDDIVHRNCCYSDSGFSWCEVPVDGSDDYDDFDMKEFEANHLYDRETFHEPSKPNEDDIEEGDEWIPVLAYCSSSEGNHGCWFVETNNADFDPKKVAFSSVDTNVASIVEDVWYDKKKLDHDSTWMDSTHKGNDAEVGWMNLRMHDTLQSIQANIEHYWDY